MTLKPAFSLGLLLPIALLGAPSGDTTVPPVPVAAQPVATEAEAPPAEEAREDVHKALPAVPETGGEPAYCETRCGTLSFDDFSATLQACGINAENSGCTYHGNGQYSNPGDDGSGSCTVTFDLTSLGAGTRANVSEHKGKGSDVQWLNSALVLKIKDGMIVKSVRLRRAPGLCLAR